MLLQYFELYCAGKPNIVNISHLTQYSYRIESIPALKKKIRLSISFLVSPNIYSSAERTARNMNSVALTTAAHEQTQYNRVWYIHIVCDSLALKTYSNSN